MRVYMMRCSGVINDIHKRTCWHICRPRWYADRRRQTGRQAKTTGGESSAASSGHRRCR